MRSERVYMTIRHKISLIAVTLCVLIAGCNPKETTPANIPVTDRDTTITVKNAFTLLKLDSQLLARYLDIAIITDTSRLLIRNFYNSRNYQYAWFNEDGLTEHAIMLWNRYKDYRSYGVDVPQPDGLLFEEMDGWLTDTSLNINPPHAQKAELELTRLFFDYAFAKFIGNLDPAEMQWYIPRRKINVARLLDSLIAGSNSLTNDWEPVHPQYRLLKKRLIDYSAIAENGGWDSLRLFVNQKLKQGSQDSLVKRVKQRLALTLQYPSEDSSNIFTRELRDSIKIVQQTYGLQPDGEIGPATLKALNVSVQQRMQQMLVNMERLRWLPQQSDSVWILANIPSFRLQVLHGDSVMSQMSAVVGTTATRTVIFSDSLKFIVFSPYWNVPASIVRNEILPAIRKNRKYLRRNNMEQIGKSNGLPIIRQRPGPTNALGKVKFLFPNQYNIYLHDTPARSYFGQTRRAFSHGCIRISEPFELAQLLLKSDSGWTASKISDAMNSRNEKWAILNKAVPVFITYFTSWVDSSGRLELREDIYGHDERMISHLFIK